MSRYQSRLEIGESDPPSRCLRCWKFTWKTITCIFSHIALITSVVAYCAAGAFTFEALEVENEKDIKRSIKGIRQNISNHLWRLVVESDVLDERNFTQNASYLIQNFEGALIKAMTKEGWDGEEDENIVQWTRTGSLFYSIVVITTIGYGHLTPKTALGKVVTIFYAILGIPLMLICLSNIGDIMATSFRFLYWRVCCYVCTKPKKPRRSRSVRSSARSSEEFQKLRPFFSSIFLFMLISHAPIIVNTAMIVWQGQRLTSFAIAVYSVAFYGCGHLFLILWLSENLSNESLKVSEAAYSSKWYEMKTKHQKMMLMMIKVGQNPFVLNCGYVCSANLRTFLKTMKAVYSILSAFVSVAKRTVKY